ncbi:nickel/cobalt transporter [Amorphus orientalis]|uniref:Nickel/cobalt efflux system n=1 Tax=Amorphus orientalis TaxID=649198 RepID=A0AAE3VSB5_9HYPH|nr:nickel/cobalt transporter [Amorphus orientalis]MDQ0317236.1 ABC-type nickel/cobalt efflux system permease component RcnA [Amorphus orientalis]
MREMRVHPLALCGLAGLILLVAMVAVQPALAAGGPFGVGAPEPSAAPVSGPLAGFFAWVAAWQSTFYRALTDSLSEIKASGAAPWLLIALSFGYGVFHAIGPGHGKAVVSSYMLANEATARRAVGLSFAASAVQATTAVVVVLIAAAVLNLTSLQMSRSIETIEIAAYAMVTLLGASLVWRKILRPAFRRVRTGPGVVTASALSASVAYAQTERHRHAGHDHGGDGHGHHGHASHAHGHHHHGHGHDHHHTTAEAAAQCGCGHSHGIDPETVARATSLRAAVAAVLAVGLRPCSGAVIVLVFALSQGLLGAGIASAYVMGLGTAITVSLLALAAVGAKGLAIRMSGAGSPLAARVHGGLEAAGALVVLFLGLTLLIATLSAS